jgi:release factor glutamine methyltransferase
MLLKEYRTYFIEKLAPLYDVTEAESFFYITLEEFKGWRRVDLALHPDALLSGAEIEKWNDVLAQLEQQKPIQYIFGKAHFYGLEFEVSPFTLIPRPETEELVEWIINDNEFKGKLQLLDIGTGTGCIAISLAKNLPDAQVWAIDVSTEALAVAKRNAVTSNIDVTFVQQDILAAETLPERYDVIVSNPPYVRNLEKQEIKQNVLDYEPHLALFVEDTDPLLFYRKIALLAKANLTQNGKLYFEINQYLGPETAEMLEQFDFKNIVLKKDIYGNDRMIGCNL